MIRRANILANTDWFIVFLYLVMLILGWLNIYAAVYDEEHGSIFDFSQRYGMQLIWILAAIMIAVITYLTDPKFFAFFAYFLHVLSILLLAGVLVLGKDIHGARSWFELGPFHFQPSEFAKVTTALALARYLTGYQVDINKFRTLIISLFFIMVPAALIFLQPDTGTALVYSVFILVLYREGFSGILMFTGIMMVVLFILSLILDKIYILLGLFVLTGTIFSAIMRSGKYLIYLWILPGIIFTAGYFLNRYFNWGAPVYYLALGSIAVFLPVYFVYLGRARLRTGWLVLLFLLGSIIFTYSVDYTFNKVLKEHQQNRVNILLGIESDPLGLGYNVNQSKIAIGSGGLTGKGFLQGTQTKFDFVPEQSTDFIFCTIGEEWGFIGTSFIVVLFLVFLLRLLQLAERQRSAFSRAYGYGALGVFFFHFTINIGMTIGLLPVIGIPLPFFSYGGSSLLAFTILLFIMIRLDASRNEIII